MINISQIIVGDDLEQWRIVKQYRTFFRKHATIVKYKWEFSNEMILFVHAQYELGLLGKKASLEQIEHWEKSLKGQFEQTRLLLGITFRFSPWLIKKMKKQCTIQN